MQHFSVAGLTILETLRYGDYGLRLDTRLSLYYGALGRVHNEWRENTCTKLRSQTTDTELQTKRRHQSAALTPEKAHFIFHILHVQNVFWKGSNCPHVLFSR